ncbi:MAG: DUF5723 family protein [Bacteroidota bacterium]
MKKCILVFFGILFSLTVQQSYSQVDGGAFNSTGSGFSVVSLNDYQCLGVNPANLGWQHSDDMESHLGMFEMGISIYSEPLTKKLVFTDLIGTGDDFSSEAQRNEAIKSFTDTELLIRLTNRLIGIAFQDKKVGGFAFTIRQHVFWHSTLNKQASEFMFDGYNAPYFDSIAIQQNGDTIGYCTNPEEASKIYNPTDISHLFYNEFVLGYGRNVVDKENFKFHAGIDFKLIHGYGVLNYNSISITQVEGYQALSPFYGVKYDEPTPSEIIGNDYKKAGRGFGIDIGLAFEVYKKTRIALALNEIGSINWNGNVYEGENVPIRLIETSGIDNYNIFSESGGIIADNTNLGKWEGLLNKRVSLPLHMRIGASHHPLEELTFGFEFLMPFNREIPGAYINPLYAAGVQYNPARWFQLSGGFSYGGGFGFNMPLGITLRPINKGSMWELGFASRDLLSWFKQKDPMVSFVFGFLRFAY